MNLHVLVRRCVKLCSRGGGLSLGKENRVSETEELVNLIKIFEGTVVTREVAGEKHQV